ncbi:MULTISPECIES: LPS export ABC transporter periplasmic protein LptC [unclassified Sphingomonas]|uniref:LPS export ABC transporter periplasmic protein LptC n=1 Tax=unclassified Sphingomonas TaxID=196159 RepID=UPI001D111573|nr:MULTISPECIES: LPS export ABC transporter periplasmic protein LptC [unclassified Sphingomonas]MCC2980517.1 LPS export ABC transporter periplasmic protein LptC [Sphingomonas sp. IC4-52]MCD2316374.1 LPS export ABC transporter periplasmic protein LptC [Sphingomonas sp. IC-11]
MSEIAVRERTRRQRWAAPGSRHDRIISITHWLLPVLIGVLAAFLVMAPLTTAGDVSFVLDKNKVEVAKERLKIQRAQYRGSDAKGQPFTLNAGSAVQRSSAEPIVEISKLAAQIRLQDGPATLTAPTGRYDMESERVKVDGPIAFRGPNNYTLDTQDATVDLKTRKLRSTDGVTGTVSQGSFSANRLDADLEARTVTLRGNARLRVNPRGAR